jgi:YesN/AraC family two-component response regulator
MAKNLKKAAQQMQAVYGDMLETQDTQKEQKAQEAREALQTQGRAGVKLDRINMAFSPSNYDFIKVMAAIRGQTMTAYVNTVLDAERERNGEKYKAAKALVEDAD